MDSSEIRTLPLVRSAEVTSFLPGSILGGGYHATFTGALSHPDVRIDGVPGLNLTTGAPFLVLPAFALADVSASLAGASVKYGNVNSVHYHTNRGGAAWSGFANASSDGGLPGSIGNLRIAGGAGGPLGRAFRAAVNVSMQSADATEFNNAGDVQIFAPEGIDTTITFTVSPGNTRTVLIPNFVEIGDEKLPASGWNEQLATARLDFLPSPRVNAFIAGYFNRSQQREPFGGGCAPCALYTPSAQRGERTQSSMVTFGIDHAVGARTSAHVRLSRASEDFTSGVLTNGASGLFDQFSFLVDNETYPVNDELVSRVLTNAVGLSAFPPNRTDLLGAVEFRMNPYGVRSTYFTRGVINGGYGFTGESRLFGNAIIRTQMSSHKLEFGSEMAFVDARLADATYFTVRDVWNEQPRVLSAFAEGLFRLGTVTLQAGLRYDSFDPNTQYPVTPGYLLPDDPSTVFDGPGSSALSPRIAVAAPFGRVKMHGSIGQAAVIPGLSQQYAGKNIDIFRFGFSNTTNIFGAPLEIYKVTSVNIGGVVHAARALDFEANAFLNKANDAPRVRYRPFDDPINPGSSKYLNTFVNDMDVEVNGFDVNAAYRFGERSTARAGISQEDRQQIENDANAGEPHKLRSLVGLVQLGSDRIPGNLDLTLALRAYSIDQGESSSWHKRFDTRIATHIDVAGLRGSVFLEGLRLLGASSNFELPPLSNDNVRTAVENDRVVLGNGAINDNVNLTSIATAGFGVLNAVDLYFLQQAEARFGNGDKMFTATEQTAAFGAAAQFRALATTPLTQSRRVILGAQLSF